MGEAQPDHSRVLRTQRPRLAARPATTDNPAGCAFVVSVAEGARKGTEAAQRGSRAPPGTCEGRGHGGRGRTLKAPAAWL